ncbi:hypothetical protein HJC23_008324 [Cyclotella cryptica]|uniref:Lipoyl-binding domain-containing protein n=1 Tax=Cyclotella cryptica TaxID=29204 RepID=A0ABD3Q5S4_9STRA|eukprot:CCRYP_008601-RA/>CCRYP_008601-RA protein AED:0.00 eAED:-0.00 QI:0/-1/0/1/-1/1/1/0/310
MLSSTTFLSRHLHWASRRRLHAIIRNTSGISTISPIARPTLLPVVNTTSYSPCNANRTTSRTFLSTPKFQSKETIPVPTMGDSITEGTIVEWVAPVGTRVSEGDVICLIETDKVTVDIKAEREGVIVQHLGEVEGVVEVGKGLYVLDTDASAAATAQVESADTKEIVSASQRDETKDGETTSPNATVSKTRIPSIHFLGKEGWNALRKEHSQSTTTASSTPTTATTTTAGSSTTIVGSSKPNASTSITYMPYTHMYGRPSITDEEMEALMLGGAEEAPLMKKEKGGVVSFYGGKVVTAGPRGVWLAEEKL